MNFLKNIKKSLFLFNTLQNNSFKEINIREQKSYLNKYKMRKKDKYNVIFFSITIKPI